MKRIILLFVFSLAVYSCEPPKAKEKNVKSQESAQIEYHITDWERSKNHTLAVIEAMPEDKLDYKATPEVRSFAFDIKHMIGGNYGMMSNALGVEAPKFDAESVKTKAEMSQAVTECYDWVIKSLGEFDTSKNSEMIEYFGKFKLTRARAIFKVYEHQAHHKSKAIANQRLAGATPPGYVLFD
ncbi:MAG: damage-inducible protein DinB [Flavobacteriaceae bacterium]|nr:damage-inducible protein DinB [Flavobacteriaceae bacterium]|tara:strand:- start:296 stop:844 length:549 start_codon:yes stop_codon:yes gene_type:complete